MVIASLMFSNVMIVILRHVFRQVIHDADHIPELLREPRHGNQFHRLNMHLGSIRYVCRFIQDHRAVLNMSAINHEPFLSYRYGYTLNTNELIAHGFLDLETKFYGFLHPSH